MPTHIFSFIHVLTFMIMDIWMHHSILWSDDTCWHLSRMLTMRRLGEWALREGRGGNGMWKSEEGGEEKMRRHKIESTLQFCSEFFLLCHHRLSMTISSSWWWPAQHNSVICHPHGHIHLLSIDIQNKEKNLYVYFCYCYYYYCYSPFRIFCDFIFMEDNRGSFS